MMLSLFRTPRANSGEREPLLPRHNRETALQANIDKKLHKYQMIRALMRGYMPSNEQAIAQLRHTADILSIVPHSTSHSGRTLIHHTRQLIEQLITFLKHKNEADSIQDSLWYLTNARLSLDCQGLRESMDAAQPKADITAVYKSLSTVGSLLLTNSDFRIFLGDLTTIGREVFRDTAFSLSTVSEEVGKQVAPSKDEEELAKGMHGDQKQAPSSDDLKNGAAKISEAVVDGAGKVVEEAGASVSERLSTDEQETLVARLKKVVFDLRKRSDYSKSVSTLSFLLRRYLLTYWQPLSGMAEGLEENIHISPEADRALRNLWRLLTSLGDPEKWRALEDSFRVLMEHLRGDPDFEQHVNRMGEMLQAMLTDPGFYDDSDKRFRNLHDEFHQLTMDSNTRDDFDAFLAKLRLAFCSISKDDDIQSINSTSKGILDILHPTNRKAHRELILDCTDIALPLLIQAVQHVPIPRLEVSTPALDLLVENLILEPGQATNRSSFFPYQMKFSTQNDIEVVKGSVGTTTSRLSTFVRLTFLGISVSASDVGYWLRCHHGLLRFGSEGIVSAHLDQRGIDIIVDLEIGKDRIDELLSVRNVRVKIHHFNYTLNKSRFSWLAWLVKPFVRPLIRMTIENHIADAIKDTCTFVNRELLFGRERLRATRIADPDSIWTFIRAVSARLVPKKDPDVYARVGVDEPGTGVFKGVYAPGSVVKLWNEDGRLAGERVQEFRQDGWRNAIFDS